MSWMHYIMEKFKKLNMLSLIRLKPPMLCTWCWRYAHISIWILFHRPELKAIEKDVEVILKFPEAEALSPPILQINEVSFCYSPNKVIFSNVNLGATLESRICIVSNWWVVYFDTACAARREKSGVHVFYSYTTMHVLYS